LEAGKLAEDEEITDESRKTMAKIFIMFIGKNRDFAEKWLGGEIVPSDDQLNLLESNCKEILEYIDKINKQLPQIVDDDYCSNTKEGVKKLKQKVQQEKASRQQQQQQPTQPNSPLNSNNIDDNSKESPANNQQISQLQNQLNQLSQQVQTLLNNQNPTDNSNNNQFQQIQAQLNALQKQIQDLENKPNNSNSSVASSDKQELTKLKNQAQQLQKNLQSKQTRNEKNTNSQPEKGFNWLYVIIPAGVLIVVMGIVIAYLVGKKNKKSVK